MKGKVFAACISTVVAAHASMPHANDAETAAAWFAAGREAVLRAEVLHPLRGPARNVILFIGDGMGISTVTAARILEGQLRGGYGEENRLSFETLPYVALVKTYNTNQQTPDSAGTMTAIMTGVKTKAGVVAVAPEVARGDCAGSKGKALTTFLELAEQAGMATGVVTTARLTHATPAAAYAHAPERGWESDRDLPAEARANGCTDIARQLIEFPHGDGIKVVLGGGRRNFWPSDQPDPEDSGVTGARDDGRNLAAEWVRRYPNAVFVWNQRQFDAIDPNEIKHLLGLFDPSHMEYEVDRAFDTGGEPSLSAMTAKALDLLARNPKGYFLVVEAGRIDHGHHAGNAYRALTETIELSRAVRTALERVRLEETLVIVTADHSHVFTIAGYPTRGNPILGKVIGNDSRGEPRRKFELAADGRPYTTLSYANGRGFALLKKESTSPFGRPIAAGRVVDLTDVDTEHEAFHQEALVPLFSETHAGEDVAVYAGGPGAHLVRGVQEQHVIYHIMVRATGMEKRLQSKGAE